MIGFVKTFLRFLFLQRDPRSIRTALLVYYILLPLLISQIAWDLSFVWSGEYVVFFSAAALLWTLFLVMCVLEIHCLRRDRKFEVIEEVMES